MNKVFLSQIFFLVFYSSIFAQQSDVSGLQQNYNIDVVKVYEKVVEDGYESVQIFQKLANTHYNRGNYIQAKKWFEKWFQLDKSPEIIAYLKFSKTLQALNEIEKAKHYLLLYENSTGK
jgi:tetratricopeptide (TPR) repeat protein